MNLQVQWHACVLLVAVLGVARVTCTTTVTVNATSTAQANTTTASSTSGISNGTVTSNQTSTANGSSSAVQATSTAASNASSSASNVTATSSTNANATVSTNATASSSVNANSSSTINATSSVNGSSSMGASQTVNATSQASSSAALNASDVSSSAASSSSAAGSSVVAGSSSAALSSSAAGSSVGAGSSSAALSSSAAGSSVGAGSSSAALSSSAAGSSVGAGSSSAGSQTASASSTAGQASSSASATNSGATATPSSSVVSQMASSTASATGSVSATPASSSSVAATSSVAPADPCAGNPCVHGTCNNQGASYNCTCNPGYTGVNCSTNIDECASSPCKYGSTCKDGVNNYTCECVQHTSGDNCDTLAAFVSQWGGWGVCDRDCGYAEQNRTRTCSDVSGATRNDCIDKVFEKQQCPGLKTCPCAVFMCDTNPDLCGSTATGTPHVCENTVCGEYTCKCAEGYVENEDKKGCRNFNECSSVENDCASSGVLVSGVKGCVDTDGNYTCECKDGYSKPSVDSRKCNDIDECSLNKADCDSADRATCTNTDGSFTCACKAPYSSGNGKSCTEDRLLSFATHTRVDKDYTPIISVPISLPYDTGSDTKYAKFAYATLSGAVLLVSTDKNQKKFPNPYGTTLQDSSFAGKPEVFIAPFWANMKLGDKTDSTRGLFYKTFVNTDSNSAETTTALAFAKELANKTDLPYEFQPQYAIVFTWSKMGDPSADSKTVTFQCVVTTDYKNTVTGFVYADRAMLWEKTLSAAGVKNFQARVGVKTPTIATEYTHSYLDVTKNSDQTLLSRMDAQTQSGQSVKGRFVYKLSNNAQSYDHPGYTCKKWIDDDKAYDTTNSITFEPLKFNTAPSAAGQIDPSFFDTITDPRIPAGVKCYIQNTNFLDTNGQALTIRACYKGTALVEEGEAAGFLNIYRRFSGVKDTTDINAAWSCCSSANLDSFASSDDLCEQFLGRRPLTSSANFTSKGLAGAIGDPHVTTLDGKAFTFNGHGEYIVSKLDGTFELQARTAFVMKNGTAQGATMYSAFAGKQTNPVSDVVEFSLNSTKDGIDVYKNKNLVANGGQDISNTLVWNNVRLSTIVKNSDTVYVMAFSSGVSVQVTVKFNLMQVVAVAPGDWAGKLTGMLGNFDGNMNNDFKYPNGTDLATGINSTEEELFYWGQEWRNTNATSLFSYSGGESWTSLNNVTFTPVFFNANLTIMFPDSAKRTSAENTCAGKSPDPDPSANRECYFDLKVTDNSAAAAGTKTAKAENEAEKKALENYAPKINGNVTLEVEVGKTYSSLHTLDATDQNGDAMTFTVNADAPSGISVSNSTKVMSWTNVQFARNATVQITVSDGTASSLWNPKVELCSCQNGGTCDFSVSSLSLFIVVPCKCTPGYEGEFCELDIDGCADNPCFTRCTDVPAKTFATTNQAFQCDPCPTGLAGDGTFCADVDECVTQKPCAQNCKNLPGSYQCSCNNGYNLAADLKSCTDVDECARGLSTCDATLGVCTNTDGSFTCACKSGYEGTGQTGGCRDIDECLTGAASCPANSNCKNKAGGYDCVCIPGYKWNAATKKCDEIDECQLDHNCKQVCKDEVGKYSCGCNAGFKLSADLISCEPESACDSTQRAACDGGNTRSICANDAANGGFLCQCPKGYALDSSKNCVDINECTAGTSLCVQSTSNCINLVPDYRCECKSGYKLDFDNRTCIDIDECAAKTDNCKQGCTNTAGSFVCTCNKGYTLNADGNTCDDVDECSSDVLNDCDSTNGVCTNTGGSYKCSCKAGYTGDGFTCIDLNECAEANRGGCTQGCSNKIGGFDCYCGNGYTLNSDGKSCDNVDECANAVSNDCYKDNSGSKYCTDTTGGYTCSCPSGFKLKSNGITCESILKCASNNTCSFTCARVNGSDICQCPTGQQLDGSGTNCTDIDECASSSTNLCNSANNVKCQNTAPGYKCVCSDSTKYQQVEAFKCIDKDECALGTFSCGNHSRCVNQDPGYKCECLSGFTKNGAGECVDDDECALKTDGCHKTLGVCTNKAPGYSCACKSGYKGDGINCADVNECADGTSLCDKRTGRSTCTNNVGSYTCNCTSGYTLASNGYTCNDIDECSGSHGCKHTCNNLDGSFRCSCFANYRLDLDQKSCVVEFNCEDTYKAKCDFDCAKNNGSDLCVCPTGKKLNADGFKCDDVDECTVSPPCDKNRGICTNTVGSYKCACNESYILGPGNVCNDRNGNWGAWGNWSTCSKTCGGGTRTRTRSCDNPTPAGAGAQCPGDKQETVDCNTDLCPLSEVVEKNGVSVRIGGGMTVAIFQSVEASFKSAVADATNGYCNTNSSTWGSCCGALVANVSSNQTFTPNASSPLVYTATAKIDIAENYPIQMASDKIEVIFILKADKSNSLCAARNSKRRKRAATIGANEISIDQALLTAILSDVTTQNTVAKAINDNLPAGTNITVSVLGVSKAEQPTTAAPTTTTVAASTAEPSTSAVTTVKSPVATGPEAWVIAVAVVGGLVGLVIIIIIVIVIIKRPSKVGSADLAGQRNEDEQRTDHA